MKGLELFTPGTGSHAVARHLHDVAQHARTDLNAAPEHQRLLLRHLAHWIDQVARDRRYFDTIPLSLATDVAFRLAPPSAVGRTTAESKRLLRVLLGHDWLETVAAVQYRPRIGTPFGTPTTHHRPASRTHR